uniref:Uncharacterized protein n=1 Tax=Globisporangium ultimum (strain ATCC 200006 / CBS 805.95 / DAOM BR144) TaxID=431595 RepID=K3WJK2_GLOUD
MDEDADTLELVRQNIRDICIHDQVRWESTWKEVLETHESARRGLILPDLFVHTLEENNVFLQKKTVRVLVRQFQVTNGGIQVAKFLNWVKLSRPTDHIDPDLAFARLPQPYRRIIKILESDILDASWELIKAQSVRYKAEAMAALSSTPRSTRSLALSNQDEVFEIDDYEAAKKRCCKISTRKVMADSQRPACVAQHESLPLVMVALDSTNVGSENQSKIELHMYNSVTCELLVTHTFDLNQDAELSPDTVSSITQKRVCVTGMTPIYSLSCHDSSMTCTVGVSITKYSTTTSADGDYQNPQTTQNAQVHIFQIGGVSTSGTPAATSPMSIQLVASAKLPDLVGVKLSPDAQFAALFVASGGITVFKLRNESDVTESGEALSPVDLNSSNAFMQIDNDAVPRTSSLAQAHFLVTPSSSCSAGKPMKTYAIVVCYRTKVQKYLLRNTTPRSKTSAQTPSHSWDHVAPITASVTDSTTQYLTVILGNGSVIVWDVLEENDHAYLPPCSETAETLRTLASKADSISDGLIMYRDEHVVTFSTSTQQVRFYDIKDRVKVQLLRVVAPPAIPSSRLGGSSDGVSILFLVETARVLDVPIAMVGYSNGFLVLYDMRNAEAIGSIRFRATAPSDAMINAIVASPHAICLAHDKSLEIFDWYQVFLASFPSFEIQLKQQNIACDGASSKRLFLSSLASPSIAPPVSLSEFRNDSIDKILRRTAGLTSSPTRHASKTALSASDSAASIGRQLKSSPSVPHSIEEALELPLLAEVAFRPCKRSAELQFAQFCVNLDATMTKEKEAKMHRRRKELIEALTTGSW